MDLSTAETIQSQSNLMSCQFSQQIISEMTNIILQAKTQFGNLSDPEFINLVLQGIVQNEKERIISEYDQSYHRLHADESDQRHERREVCDKGIQISEENLLIKRPVVPIQQLRPIQQPNNHFKKNEQQNIKEKNETKPANLSSGPIQLEYKTAEYVSTSKPANNHVDLEDPSLFAGNDFIVETTRSVPQGSVKPSVCFSRSSFSHSASQRLKVNEIQKIISSKQEQVRKAVEQTSTHAKLAENFCYLVKQFANKAIQSSIQDLEGAQEIKRKTLNFQMQAQIQAQNTRKEALNCNQVVSEIRDLLEIVSFDEQISPQTAVRLTKMILKALKDGEQLARFASKRKDFASHFAKIATSYAEEAKSALRTVEQQSLARNSSKNRHPQKVLTFKKRIKGSQQDEKKLIDLQHQLSKHRLKMKRASLSLQKQQ